MKITTWDKVVEFFNHQYADGPKWQNVWRQRFISDRRFKKTSLTLIETYRCYLMRAGYLKSVGPECTSSQNISQQR